MKERATFLSLFAVDLGVVALAFFAWQQGLIGWVYQNDATMITSLISGQFFVAVLFLGWKAWGVHAGMSADDGHLLARLSVYLGYVGTAVGALMQLQHLSTAGVAAFGALAVSLTTTATGGVAAYLIEIMTRLLEAGIERAQRS